MEVHELVEETISPFIEKLISDEKIKEEMQESRHRARLARMSWSVNGSKRGRF